MQSLYVTHIRVWLPSRINVNSVGENPEGRSHSQQRPKGVGANCFHCALTGHMSNPSPELQCARQSLKFTSSSQPWKKSWPFAAVFPETEICSRIERHFIYNVYNNWKKWMFGDGVTNTLILMYVRDKFLDLDGSFQLSFKTNFCQTFVSNSDVSYRPYYPY